MFTGLYPSEHHADWGHGHLAKGLPTLGEQLQGAGYQTVGFSENVFVGRSVGLARGFGEFHETWRRPLVVRAIARVATRVLGYKKGRESAECSVGILKRWLLNNDHRGKPYFAFVNLMAAHLPRYPRSGVGAGKWTKKSLARIDPVNLVPERYYLPKFKLNQDELTIMAEIYDGEITYLDAQIGDVMSVLDRTGIRDKTIVIVTSDHGENFGEHGLIEYQFRLYDTLLHVPLIVRYPGVLKAETVERMVSTVFLGRTVMALVGFSGSGGSEQSGIGALGELEGQDYVIAECGNGVEMLRGVVDGEGLGVEFSRFDKSLKPCLLHGIVADSHLLALECVRTSAHGAARPGKPLTQWGRTVTGIRGVSPVMAQAKELQRHMREEQRVQNQITPPKSPGLLEQAVEPFKARTHHPTRRLRHSAGVEIKRGAHAQ
jgi:hypothetical protein